ncbi:hypothetical protein MTP99_005570 [Tenebrio molitor]|nr:hypothetical protein MTP99_005570 [Tenebrio molitor]
MVANKMNKFGQIFPIHRGWKYKDIGSRQLEEKLTSFFVLKGSGGLIFYHSQEIVINIFRLFCDCSLQCLMFV